MGTQLLPTTIRRRLARRARRKALLAATRARVAWQHGHHSESLITAVNDADDGAWLAELAAEGRRDWELLTHVLYVARLARCVQREQAGALGAGERSA